MTGAPPDVSYFYNDLSPYGSWVNLEGYGWCWQPRAVVVSPGWRPYCDGGYWVYSDAGWYWQSTYSWGWAPFHYGRWYAHPRCGWVWMPDRVWGPAWVTWRTGGDILRLGAPAAACRIRLEPGLALQRRICWGELRLRPGRQRLCLRLLWQLLLARHRP